MEIDSEEVVYKQEIKEEDEVCFELIKDQNYFIESVKKESCPDVIDSQSFFVADGIKEESTMKQEDEVDAEMNEVIEFIEEEINCEWSESALIKPDPLDLSEIKDTSLLPSYESPETSCSSTTNEVFLSYKPVAVVTPSSTPQTNDKTLSSENEIKCFSPPLSKYENHTKAKQGLTFELQENVFTLRDATKPNEDLNDFQEVASDNITDWDNEDSDYLPSSDEDTNESDSDRESCNKISSKPKEKIYNKSSSGITLNSVEKYSNGKVVRNKGHCCLFCYKVMVNLPRHMELRHNAELVVAKLLCLEKNSTSRRNGFIELSRLGDYHHNCEVLEKKTGELILVRRPKPDEVFAFNKYFPCPDCLGFLLKKHLWHHVKFSCTSQGNRFNLDCTKLHRKVLAESKELLANSLNRNIPSLFVEKLLSRLRQDHVSEDNVPQTNDKPLSRENEVKFYPPPLSKYENQTKEKQDLKLELQEIVFSLQDTTEDVNDFQEVTSDNIIEWENDDSDYLPSSDEDTNESDSDRESCSKPKEKIYNKSSSGITLNSVEKDSNGKVLRNKGHCCLFCYKVMVNLPRHMELLHCSEPEVAKLLCMEKNSVSRRNGFIELSRVGDYHHNCEVLEKKTGELILVRRPKPDEKFAFNKYSPCPDCLGFMLKKHLWHHVKFSCTSQGNRFNLDCTKQHRNVLAESKVLLASSLNRNIPSLFVEKILSRLRQDHVSEVCKEDELIINFGVFMFEKYGLTHSETTRQYMRQLARLLIVLNENKNKTKLSEWLKPESFEEIIDAVKKVCVQENVTLTNRPTYKIPSLVMKLGNNIRKCIGIERGQALRVCNKDRNIELKDLVNMMEVEWTAKLLSNVLK